MAYATVDAAETEASRPTPDGLSAPPSSRERLRAGLILAGLLSLVAVFWGAVIRLAAMA